MVPAAGQICAGFAELRGRPFRLAASAASYSYATALEVSAASGRSAFAALAVGRTHDDELDATTTDLRLEGGLDVAVAERQVFVCPSVAVSVEFGPNEFLTLRTDYRRFTIAASLGLAGVAARSTRLGVIVASRVRTARVTVTRNHRITEPFVESGSDLYWLFELDVGFVIVDQVTIRPSLSVPFGLIPPGESGAWVVPFGREEGELGLGISIGVSFGRRRGVGE